MKQAEVWIWPEGCSLLTPAYINGQDRYCELCTWFNSYKNRKENLIHYVFSLFLISAFYRHSPKCSYVFQSIQSLKRLLKVDTDVIMSI